MTDRNTSKQILSVLLGERLSIWRRAADMLVVHFGRIERSETKSWGQFSLHVQCPWRVLQDGTMFTGDGDLYVPAEETENFDWDKWCSDGSWSDNLMESRMRSVLKGTDSITKSLENITDDFVVENVTASALGDASIQLSGGFQLDLFPDGVDGEHWRLVDLTTGKHFVVESSIREDAGP